MPLYEYECINCHERTEKIQKFSDPEITVCPHCSGHLERVLPRLRYSPRVFSLRCWALSLR